MNELSLPEPFKGEDRHRRRSLVNDRESNLLQTHLRTEHQKDLAHTDCRLSALKALALTLLTRIESLETADPKDLSHLDLQTEVRRFEADLIRSALITTGGRQRKAARLLGMKVPTLNAKIKRYMIDVPLARISKLPAHDNPKGFSD